MTNTPSTARKSSPRRSAVGVVLLILLFTVLLCLVSLWLTSYGTSGKAQSGSLFSDPATAGLLATAEQAIPSGGGETQQVVRPILRVVIDPGHGGEDGGAQSKAGLYEKDVNLSVALYLRDLFEAAGVPVVMTRTEDILLYDRSVNYQGRKKVLDLAARLTVARSVPDSLFLSIHMNAFPQTQYSGMQVWYAPGDPRSQELAAAVQTRGHWLDGNNKRRIKAAGNNIYLLHNLDTPAILVEGGFLSNPEEAEKLGTEAYQKALAFVIFTGVMESIGGGTA